MTINQRAITGAYMRGGTSKGVVVDDERNNEITYWFDQVSIDQKLLEKLGCDEEISSGCCGLAGNFGMEQAHYDVSVRSAEDGILNKIKKSPDREVLAEWVLVSDSNRRPRWYEQKTPSTISCRSHKKIYYRSSAELNTTRPTLIVNNGLCHAQSATACNARIRPAGFLRLENYRACFSRQTQFRATSGCDLKSVY